MIDGKINMDKDTRIVRVCRAIRVNEIIAFFNRTNVDTITSHYGYNTNAYTVINIPNIYEDDSTLLRQTKLNCERASFPINEFFIYFHVF